MLNNRWLVLIFALSSTCFASTLVIARRPNNTVLIATDSLQHGDRYSLTKCKIQQSGGTYFAIAGWVFDGPRGFDVEAIVANALSVDQPLDSQLDRVLGSMRVAIRNELASLSAQDPGNFRILSEKLPAVALARVEGGVAKLYLIIFIYDKTTNGHGATVVKCPGPQIPPQCEDHRLISAAVFHRPLT